MAEDEYARLMRDWHVASDRARAAEQAMREAYDAYFNGTGSSPSPDLQQNVRELREHAAKCLQIAVASVQRSRGK